MMMIISKLPMLSSSFTTTAVALFLMISLVHSQDVTDFGYGSFYPNAEDLLYQGGAYVPERTSILRLTQTDSEDKPMSRSIGRVLYKRPVKFWEASSRYPRQASFDTSFNFRITPSKDGAADGLVFFIAPLNAVFDAAATSGPNFGIFNGSAGGTAPSVFAVEFDTYVNRGWDPSYRHIGIDIESRASRATARFDSGTGEVVLARLKYDAYTKTIRVEAGFLFQSTTEFSYNFDLKTILPQWVEVGISASTGQTVSYLGVHDLNSWTFTSYLVSNRLNQQEDTYIRQIVV